MSSYNNPKGLLYNIIIILNKFGFLGGLLMSPTIFL